MNRRSAGRSAFKSSGRIAPRRKSRPSRGRFAVHLAFAHSSPVPWEAFEMVFGIRTPSGKAPIGFSQAWRTLAIHAGAEPYSGSGIGSSLDGSVTSTPVRSIRQRIREPLTSKGLRGDEDRLVDVP